MPEGDPGVESMPDKGKAVVGVKRRSTKDASGPTVKWPRVESGLPDLEAVDNLVGLMEST